MDICGKYAQIVLLKDKNGITISNAFQKVLDKTYCKPKNVQVKTFTEYYNRSMESWLEDDLFNL